MSIPSVVGKVYKPVLGGGGWPGWWGTRIQLRKLVLTVENTGGSNPSVPPQSNVQTSQGLFTSAFLRDGNPATHHNMDQPGGY